MPYVNDTGPVTEANMWPRDGANKFLPDDDPDVIAFLNRPADDELTAEELYSMLETKGVVTGADRPPGKPK